jgi:hypothetical protein
MFSALEHTPYDQVSVLLFGAGSRITTTPGPRALLLGPARGEAAAVAREYL